MDYREILIDCHITELKKEFLSKLDPKVYAARVAEANCAVSMIYTCDHNGTTFYPTKFGQEHQSLKGRDVVNEIITELKKRKIGASLYYSLIFNCWAFNHYPDWRMMRPTGEPESKKRYGLVCPNSPYRELVSVQIKELCARFDFRRIFLDMTFWSNVCYCRHCKARFKKETGYDMPETIDWTDKVWVLLQRKREEWMREFALFCTAILHQHAPEVKVTHQFAPYVTGAWILGVPFDMADACDYISGDFYGDAANHSFANKVFQSLSGGNYEFLVSACVDLWDHTTLKSIDLLRSQVFQCIAHGARVVYIDAMDPVGTLNRTHYQRMGKVFKEVAKHEKYLPGGELVADVALYFSDKSRIDLEDNGTKVTDWGRWSNAYLKTVINTARRLYGNHVPFTIITKRGIKDLAKYKAVLIPDAAMLDREECDAIREYVKNGGSIYGSRFTGLLNEFGEKKFTLGDIFGVRFVKETQENQTYLTMPGGQDLIIKGTQAVVKLAGGKKLASQTLPYTDPKDVKHFASIHSNPPGIYTDKPAIVLNRYGKGKAIYSTGMIENEPSNEHNLLFMELLKELTGGKYFFSADTHPDVEMTAFRHKADNSYILNMLNFQQGMPNVPVRDISVKVALPKGEKAVRLLSLPEEKQVKFKVRNSQAEFMVEELVSFKMYKLMFKGD